MYESYINKIEDVGKLRNLKPKTITLYQKNVSRFLNYIKKNPEELTCEDARNYLLHLQGKGDKASTLNNNNGSLVFFYKRVLGKLWDDNLVPRAINDYAVPEVLSFHDVDIRYIQTLLGHRSPKSTEIYLHVSNKALLGVQSPFDKRAGEING